MKKKKTSKGAKPKSNPLFMVHRGFGNKPRKLHFFESATHLTSIVNYKLPNETEVGALLLDTNKSLDDPEYKLRFIWECQGIHSDYGEIEAESIVNSIAALSRELPIGERLRVEYHCFSNYDARQAELEGLFENAPVTCKRLIAEEMKILQDLDAKGQRRPKRIFLMGTFTASLRDRESELTEKILKFGITAYQKLSGSVKEVRQQKIDKILLDAYEQGFLKWQNLFRDKLQVQVKPLSGEKVWQHCRAELNRFNDRKLGIEPEVAPQLIQIDLVNGTIGETIRRALHPTSLIMRQPSAIPTSNRDHVSVDRKHIGSMLFKSQPRAFEEQNRQSLPEVQLNYLWKLLDKDVMRDCKIVLELSRPEIFGTRFNNQQLIRQEHYRKKAADAKGQIDVAADIALQESIDAEKQLIGGDPIIEFALTLFLYRDTPEAIHSHSQEIHSYFQSPADMVLEMDTCDSLWLSSLPIYGNSMLYDSIRDRRDRERSQVVASYYPLVTTVNAHKSGLEFIATDGGSPVYLDPFKHMGHIALWGKTRSGKSLFAAMIIQYALAQGIPATILDLPPDKKASTFRDFTLNMGGAYIDIFNDALNFFETPEIPLDLDHSDREDLKKQNTESILQILGAMVLGAKGELPNTSSSKVYSLLTRALKRFFGDNQIMIRYDRARRGGIGSEEWKTYPVLGDFLGFCSIERINLKDVTEDDINTLSTIKSQLERWIDGSYGQTINSPSSVNLNLPLMTIAMRGVSSPDEAAVFGTIMYAAAMRRAIASADKKGSLLFNDEASITFKLAPLSLAIGRIAANGLKAGMRLMLAAQEPTSVYNSAGGMQIKDALSYHLIGRIGSLPQYCDPNILDVPQALAIVNADDNFLPDTATCSSQWLLKLADRFTHVRIYLPPSLVSLTANNIDERQERKARTEAAGREENSGSSQKVLIHH